MADQNGAAAVSEAEAAPVQVETGAESGDAESEQYQPFFSMCQPIRSVSYSNSWDMSNLDSMDDKYMLSAPWPENEQPQSENDMDLLDGDTNMQSEPLSTEQPSSNACDPVICLMVHTISLELKYLIQLFYINCDNQDEIDIWDGKTKQDSSSLLDSKLCNSGSGAEPCNMEGQQFSLSFSRNTQSQLVMIKMVSVHSVLLKNILMNQSEDYPELSSDFRPGQQEDAHEFLRCLLDNLDKCTTDPKPKDKPSSFDEESIVKQVFGGRLKSKLTCCECGHCSETYEPFLDLSLEIDQADNLIDALESFTKLERIGDAEDKLNCEHCNAKVCKNKQLMLDRSPDVVAIHLKRFTSLDRSVEKIDKHVVYPLELDLKPFHCDPDINKELKYDLYGVVEHSGSPSYGHYVCSVRSSPSTWHLMNDSHVDLISEASALNQEGYILFYIRQGKFQWFSSLLEQKDDLHPENTSGASPVSVLENIDVDCPTSSGEATNSSGDKLEKDETSQCKTSFLEEPAKGCPIDAINKADLKDEIVPCISSHHDCVAIRCPGSAADITNLDRPSTPSPKRKRFFSDDNEFNVFEFEDFGDEDETPLLGNLKFTSKAKKAKVESASKSTKGPCIDKNVTRLVRSMPSTRRKGIVDCLSQLNAEQDSGSCPRSHPLGKKKLGIPVPIKW
uniref:USP domain-containing protein n=1 Tax=Oryza nivara TaxID=4536 RepID=A0A0E0GBJ3_ORYNI